MGYPARFSSRRGEALEGERFSPIFVELEHLLLEVVDDIGSPRIAFRPILPLEAIESVPAQLIAGAIGACTAKAVESAPPRR